MLLKDKIKRYMNKFGLTQVQFAKRVGMSPETLSQNLKATKKFSKVNEEKLEKFFADESFLV